MQVLRLWTLSDIHCICQTYINIGYSHKIYLKNIVTRADNKHKETCLGSEKGRAGNIYYLN